MSKQERGRTELPFYSNRGKDFTPGRQTRELREETGRGVKTGYVILFFNFVLVFYKFSSVLIRIIFCIMFILLNGSLSSF